jgi:hypothetical protein
MPSILATRAESFDSMADFQLVSDDAASRLEGSSHIVKFL